MPGQPIADGYAMTGSADYAAAARRGELNDVNRGGLSGCRAAARRRTVSEQAVADERRLA